MAINTLKLPWFKNGTRHIPRTAGSIDEITGHTETEKRKGEHTLLAVVLGLAVPLLALSGVTAWYHFDSQIPRAVTQTYLYNPDTEKWVKVVFSEKLLPGPDGVQPEASNTIIINIDEDNPVKKIVIGEAMIKGGNEPILEIAGHDNITGVDGKLNIGTLTFKKVDAEKLEIRDTEAVRMSIANVAAEDNELDVDVNIVNVVRTGRGGPNNLYLGINSGDDFKDIVDDPRVTFADRERTGLRADRIRILGPVTGNGFIETLTIKSSSFFGKIEVSDVEVQDLVLQDIFLDDSF